MTRHLTRGRRRAANHSPAERLALLLEAAYVAAYLAHNPWHDAPGWAVSPGERLSGRDADPSVTGLARTGFLAVAEELLARGVKPPLDGARPAPVGWVRYEDDYCI